MEGGNRTDCVFVMAHGAGGHMADRGMLSLDAELTRRGIDVVRFNFPYTQKGSKRPDPMPVLKQCIADVADRVRREKAPRRLILGGRSMGGRAASMLAAEGFACEGLILLAYPLHPAGQPDRLRVDHLSRIEVPILCINGTRDALCQRELMEPAIAALHRWTMHWLDGADHSFHVLKSSGRTDAQVIDEVGRTAAAWLATLKSQESP